MMSGKLSMDKLTEVMGISEWSERFQGFLFGILFVLLFLIIILLLRFLIARKRKFKGVVVEAPSGNLYISLNAIRQFMHRIINEFDDVTMSALTLAETRGQIVFGLELEVMPSAELVPLRDQIQKRVLEDAEKQLGLDMPVKVNLDIRNIQNGGKKVSRSERKRKAHAREQEVSGVANAEKIDDGQVSGDQDYVGALDEGSDKSDAEKTRGQSWPKSSPEQNQDDEPEGGEGERT